MRGSPSLALVPARAGSKRLRDKMRRVLGGKTLVQWTVEAVIASGQFERIVVSSDAEAILEPVLGYPGVEARLRPAELASDTATTMQVLMDFVQSPGRHPLHPRCVGVDHRALAGDSVIALCQPTTPFRTGLDITATVALLGSHDTAISVMAAPVPPQRSFPMSATGECVIDSDSPLRQGRTRQQLFEEMYTPNGGVYVSTLAHLQRDGSFFAGRVGGHQMPRERSLDIDDEFDWRIAEAIWRAQS